MSGRERKRTRSWEVDVSLEELVSWDVLDQFMGDMPSEPVQPEQSSSSSDALGLSRGLGSTQMPLSPALHGSQLPLMAPACGGSSSRYGLDAPAHQPAHANAATLAQSFMSEWQQGVPWQGALPGVGMPRAISWGTEFLSGTLGGDEGMGMVVADPDGGIEETGLPRAAGAGGGGLRRNDSQLSMAGSETGEHERPANKQRFVWTAELHHRFEAAVNTLGIDHAKPQAISQLMNCEGEGAPTRQNIKSHLQKYRLLMQKRARQQQATSQGGAA
eukprot:CAMPEP_0118819368 /NCGR_PEP_ID=MMETSP1162-20130426/6892_1 /TAXON_ID=33656 /ORGANISM="Phaeocystis Sp, Strain CCMP2710" /LENGTH=272 /DNA_ID=CAMNT_0006749653 /DNA_START=102 /DNA_END=917 /DNA_ORIENTATION=-